MSRGVNSGTFIGRLKSDPDMQYSPQGKPRTKFSMETPLARTEDDGTATVGLVSVSVVCFGPLAEIANQYLAEGRWVCVQGHIKNSQWMGRDDKPHYRTEIVAEELTFLSGPLTLGLNICILVGNLGRDPETRYTVKGVPLTTFPIAVNTPKWGGDAGETEVTWVNIACFGELSQQVTGELAPKPLSKGQQVAVVGYFHTYSWEKQDGTRMYRTEVVASQVNSPTAEEAAAAGEEAGLEDEEGDEWGPETEEELPF